MTQVMQVPMCSQHSQCSKQMLLPLLLPLLLLLLRLLLLRLLHSSMVIPGSQSWT
jgi:hypothetical protein